LKKEQATYPDYKDPKTTKFATVAEQQENFRKGPDYVAYRDPNVPLWEGWHGLRGDPQQLFGLAPGKKSEIELR
jgi:hypothetical protein